jgi:hypothetical protein
MRHASFSTPLQKRGVVLCDIERVRSRRDYERGEIRPSLPVVPAARDQTDNRDKNDDSQHALQDDFSIERIHAVNFIHEWQSVKMTNASSVIAASR